MALPPELEFKDREPLVKAKLDRAFEYIMAKFRTLDSHVPDWIKAVDELRQVGLQRIDEAIRPAYQRVMNLAKFGFLLASSETRLTLAVGDRRVFAIDDEAQRSLFTPTAFVTVTRTANATDWAIARVERYDADNGLLTVVIEAAHVSSGAHDDWQITASAGSVSAAIALLADTRAARDAAIAIKNDTAAIKLSAVQDILVIRDAAQAARLAAERAANDANTAALLIEGGPVASVNGETGNVLLTQDSIPGLTTALISKADAAAVVAGLALKADATPTATALSDRYTKADMDAMLNEVAVALADALDRKHNIGAPILEMLNTVLSAQPSGVAVGHTGGTQSATLQYDGNIYGPVWGDYLSNWVAAQDEAVRQWVFGTFVRDIRLAGWWESGIGSYQWNYGPGSGAVMAAIHCAGPIANGAAISNFGGRFLQKLIGNNWYAVETV